MGHQQKTKRRASGRLAVATHKSLQYAETTPRAAGHEDADGDKDFGQEQESARSTGSGDEQQPCHTL